MAEEAGGAPGSWCSASAGPGSQTLEVRYHGPRMGAPPSDNLYVKGPLHHSLFERLLKIKSSHRYRLEGCCFVFFLFTLLDPLVHMNFQENKQNHSCAGFFCPPQFLLSGGFGTGTQIELFERKQKSGFAECALVPVWYQGTSECTLVPVFGTGEHPNARSFWFFGTRVRILPGWYGMENCQRPEMEKKKKWKS